MCVCIAYNDIGCSTSLHSPVCHMYIVLTYKIRFIVSICKFFFSSLSKRDERYQWDLNTDFILCLFLVWNTYIIISFFLDGAGNLKTRFVVYSWKLYIDRWPFLSCFIKCYTYGVHGINFLIDMLSFFFHFLKLLKKLVANITKIFFSGNS